MSSHNPLSFGYKIALGAHALFEGTPFFVTLQPRYNTMIPTSRALRSSSFWVVHIAVSGMMIADDLGTVAKSNARLDGAESVCHWPDSVRDHQCHIAQPRLYIISLDNTQSKNKQNHFNAYRRIHIGILRVYIYLFTQYNRFK